MTYIPHGRIGGTAIAAICGLSRWMKPIDVFMALTHPEENQPDLAETNEFVEWGQRLESPVADAYAEKTGVELIRIPAPGHIFHPDYDFAAATPDRLIKGQQRGLEVKTAGISQARLWADGQVPDAYLIQVAWYQFVTRLRDPWDIATLIGGNSFRIVPIEYSEGLGDQLLNIAGEFWTNHVLTGIPPEVEDSPNYERAAKRLFPRIERRVYAIASIQENEIGESLVRLNEEKKRIESQIQKYENELMMAIQDQEGIEGIGFKASFFERKGRTTIDTKALIQGQGIPADIVEQYTKQGESTRVFKFTAKADGE